MMSTTYRVTGMTCEHCVRAVTSEIGALDGVGLVTVDLVPGGVSAVTVTSGAPLTTEAIGEALDEAGGYRLAREGDGQGDSDSDGRPAAPVRTLPIL